MLNMKCFAIPVITVTKGLIRYQEIIRGKHSVGCLQNTARLDKPTFLCANNILFSLFFSFFISVLAHYLFLILFLLFDQCVAIILYSDKWRLTFDYYMQL